MASLAHLGKLVPDIEIRGGKLISDTLTTSDPAGRDEQTQDDNPLSL
jgi:hypothetical protein